MKQAASQYKVLWPVWLTLGCLLASLLLIPFSHAPYWLSPGYLMWYSFAGICFWWLLAPWAGSGTLLTLLTAATTGFIYGGHAVQILCYVVTAQIVLLNLQKGYMQLLCSPSRRSLLNYWIFDDRLVSKNQWLGLFHPMRQVLQDWQFPHSSYQHMQVMNTPPSYRSQESKWLAEHLMIYWPATLSLALYFYFFFAYSTDIFFGGIAIAIYRAVTFYIVPHLLLLWAWLLPWSGWLPLLLLASANALFFDNGPAGIVVVVLLLQKGYLLVVRRGWREMMIQHAIIDTRISEYNRFINRFHPVTLGHRLIKRAVSNSHYANILLAGWLALVITATILLSTWLLQMYYQFV